MALTKVSVKRAVQAAGDDFLTLQDGSTRLAQAVGIVDENGDHAGISANPLVVSTGSPASTRYQSGATPVTDDAITAAGTRIQELRVILAPSTTNARYVMLFNAIATPANGTVPDWTGLVPGGGELSEAFGAIGLGFDTGLSIGISSTPGTYTQVLAGEAYLMVIETAF